MRSIFLGSDHGGFKLKAKAMEWLRQHHAEYAISDMGTFDGASVDYPDIAKRVADAVATSPEALGILICGTGNGMAISANKVRGIRAALVFDEFTGQMARAHNHANIICLGERSTPEQHALAALQAWLETPEDGDRHQRRVEKISGLERA